MPLVALCCRRAVWLSCCNVVVDDERTPPPYFGDYPHGAYWSAIAPRGEDASVEEDETPPAKGSELRVMWDENRRSAMERSGSTSAGARVAHRCPRAKRVRRRRPP